MVQEFLYNYKDELNKEAQKLILSIEQLEAKIRENDKFIDLLKNEEDYSSQEFSPRKVHSKSDERIAELQLQIDRLVSDKLGYEQSLERISVKQAEADRVIECYSREKIKERFTKETIIEPVISSVIENDVDIKSTVESNENREDLGIIKTALDNILSYIDYDPTRAKLEIQAILQKME